MNKAASFSVFLIIMVGVFCLANRVLADGMAIEPDPYSDRWDYSSETNQQAFINYEDGLQKMILSVGINPQNNNGIFWIFPVPATPEKVVLDIVSSLPQLDGEEISKRAEANLRGINQSLQLTQIYTVPFVFSIGYLGGAGNYSNSLSAPDMGFENSRTKDVVVYENIQKEGITSELVTAKTGNGLFDYLKNKGLKIENGSISVLDKYIGQNYSFVVSWITSQSPTISETYNYDNEKVLAIIQRGIFVTFPTSEIYFPLMPTSVYGSKIVPATIRIIGHVSPQIFQDIKSYTKTEYYVVGYASFGDDLKSFYNGQNQNIKYTKIDINAPSKFLTDDFWAKPIAPIKTYYSSFIASNAVTVGIFLLVLLSIFSGILAGLICFKDLRRKPLKLILLGLFNIFTIIGLLIATALFKTKNELERQEQLSFELKQKGYFWKRKISTILFFVAAPLLLFGSVAVMYIADTFYYARSNSDFLAILFSILPLIVLVVAFVLRKTKAEDKILFEQLKAANYSTWTLQPKDRWKILFVPIFSVIFLIVSWAVTELMIFIA